MAVPPTWCRAGDQASVLVWAVFALLVPGARISKLNPDGELR